MPRLLPWLDERRPDVVCLQETKLADDAFTELLGDELADRGYEIAAHGEAAWNGVAILSRTGLDDIVTGLAGAPGFPHPEARAVAATCGGVRVHSVYVPNGRTPGSDHYEYKLAWLSALRDVVAGGPDAAVVCGDMNIAPTDADVFDPHAYIGQTHVTPPEREALAEAAGARAARRRARQVAHRARVHVLGLPGGHVPPGPGHAHRSDPCQRPGRRPRAGGMGRPPGPQGQGAERPRTGDHRSRRGTRRRHRPGRAAPVEPGHQARREEAPPVLSPAGPGSAPPTAVTTPRCWPPAPPSPETAAGPHPPRAGLAAIPASEAGTSFGLRVTPSRPA